MKIDKKWWKSTKNGENRQKMVLLPSKMVLPQAMAWVQYWFRVLSLKFCEQSKKNCGDISQVSPAFCMYAEKPKFCIKLCASSWWRLRVCWGVCLLQDPFAPDNLKSGTDKANLHQIRCSPGPWRNFGNCQFTLTKSYPQFLWQQNGTYVFTNSE